MRLRVVASLAILTTVVMQAAVACGGSSAASRTATTGPGLGDGTAASPASATARPRATPESSPTARPTATPTPAELTFSAPDGGSSASTAPSTGPLGIKYAEAAGGYDAAKNRIQAWAKVNVGVNEHPSASAWLYNDFVAPGTGSTPVTAQISTTVTWKGVLAGNGAAGTGASVNIVLSVLDAGVTKGSTEVHTLEQREKALTVGGFDDISSAPVSLQLLVVPGRTYELRLTLTCQASSGLIGAATYCAYGPSDLYQEGYVDWGERSVLFSQ